MAIKNSSKILIFILIAGLIVLYGYSRIKNLFLGPEIIIDFNEKVVSEEIINLSGQAKRVQDLYLNQKSILTDQDGHFKETLILHTGYNIIELRAKDRFNREVVETLEITKI